MTRLGARDLTALTNFGRGLAERAEGDLGAPAALDALLQLIRADVIEWGTSDDRQRRLIELRHYPPLVVLRSDDPLIMSTNDAFWDAWSTCPVCGPPRLRTRGAMRLSEIRDTTAAHPQHFQCPGITVGHQLNVFLRPGDIVPRHAIFSRENGVDFTERDRLVLELTGTFLTQEARLADASRDAAVALAAFDASPGDGAHALMILDAKHRPARVSDAARQLMQKHFGWEPSVRRLPPTLDRWLDEGDLFERVSGRDRSTLPAFRHVSAMSELTIRSVSLHGHLTLMFDERGYDPMGGKPLSRREREILDAVAEGLTNSQVAARLSISPATVGKHLENAFAKLDVRSRAAAVALLARASSGTAGRGPLH